MKNTIDYKNNTSNERILLSDTFKKETPLFFYKYRQIILNTVEDYIHLPDFSSRPYYIMEEFDKSIDEKEITDEKILSEIDKVKKIIYDLVWWDFNWLIDLDNE